MQNKILGKRGNNKSYQKLKIKKKNKLMLNKRSNKNIKKNKKSSLKLQNNVN